MAELRSLVLELANLPEGPPIVTLYLDARWKDEQQRERVRLFFHERAREARATFAGDDPEAHGIRQTLERLARFVDGLVNQDIHPDARGVMVVASEPRGLYEELFIDQPFEPALFVDSKPRLYPLIEAAALAKPAYLVQVEATGATVTELRAGGVVERQSVEREVPSRHKQGGWSALRFEQHIRQHIRLVWVECARLLADIVKEDGVGPVVLFGQEPTLRAFARELPAALREQVIALRPMPRDPNDIFELARAALEDERVAHEFATIHHVLRQGLADRSGTVGVDDTLVAMNERRVKLLVLSRRFNARGYRCTSCDALQKTGAMGCGFCGGPTTLVNLREELVRRAVAQGAEVLVTPETGPLDVYRGIGAILRHLSGNERQRPTLAAAAPQLGAGI